jgi:2,4-dienoyl-CoA reductase-like NADH-dependent reductase (Old Yellow Enzyme family)
MSQLFTPLTIGNLNLSNRTVRSATWEGMADENGFVQPKLIDLLARLAGSSVELVIPGYFYIRPDGRGLPWQTGIWSDAHVDSLGQIARAVHDQGGLAAAQIAHAGGRTRREIIRGQNPAAPSAVEGLAHGEPPRELGRDEIKDLVQEFGDAAGRAKKAGFDAVQLHAAHCYLISPFLNPYFNRRQDEYGGSAAGRRRFLIEVYDAVRAAGGRQYPILIKINSTTGKSLNGLWSRSTNIWKCFEKKGWKKGLQTKSHTVSGPLSEKRR